MASFGYGSSDKHITSTDADGVALAAIQGLNLKLTQELADVREEKQTEIDRLEAELAKQRATSDEQFASLEQRLLAMEASMN
jgi:glycogen debranching enzyme